MPSNIFQIVQRLLISAVAVVLALVVGTTFLRIIRPPDEEALRRAELAASTTTTLVVTEETSTTTTVLASDTEPTETTTTIPDVDTCPEPDTPEGDGLALVVFYSCGSSVVPSASTFVYRTVEPTEAVLTATLQQMVQGPSEDEREAGYRSFFSSATSDALAGIAVNGSTAVIDFTGLDDVDGISNPEQNVFLLADLNATVFQFDTIGGVEYRLDGNCGAFGQMLGRDGCQAFSRRAWNDQLSDWRGGR